jgi:hypothetical protein
VSWLLGSPGLGTFPSGRFNVSDIDTRGSTAGVSADKLCHGLSIAEEST